MLDMKNILTMICVDINVKVRDHCHITEKYIDFAHKDFNTTVKLNPIFPAYFTT